MSIITNSEHQANLVSHAYARELEVYSYQINIDNYTAMLAALPSDEWPASLSGYSSTAVADLPQSLSDEDIELISDYQYRDRLRTLLRTEKTEQTKSRRVLEALKVQLGEDADALIAAYKASQTS